MKVSKCCGAEIKDHFGDGRLFICSKCCNTVFPDDEPTPSEVKEDWEERICKFCDNKICAHDSYDWDRCMHIEFIRQLLAEEREKAVKEFSETITKYIHGRMRGIAMWCSSFGLSHSKMTKEKIQAEILQDIKIAIEDMTSNLEGKKEGR